MLAPEVWKFQPPSSLFTSELIQSNEELLKKAKKQYFNHFISVVLPNVLKVPESIIHSITQDSIFYHGSNVFAFEFVRKEFINLFIKKGHLTLLSVGTKLDEDDCVAVTPNGKLILSLRRKTFQMLGIEGKASGYCSKNPERYIVNIDLTADSFCPGKKNYHRVLERLQSMNDLQFNVIFAWEPHEDKICPSSIAAYFAAIDYKVKSCNLNLNQRRNYNVVIPNEINKETAENIIEWLAAFSLDCDTCETPNEYTNTYRKPEGIKIGQVAYIECSGLFTIRRIENIMKEINNFLSSESHSYWISLNVQGFDDSVVYKGEAEHFYYTGGDHHYTIFLKNQSPALFCSFVNSTKKPARESRKQKKKKR